MHFVNERGGSLVNRITLGYVTLAAALVICTSFATAAFAIIQEVRSANLTLGSDQVEVSLAAASLHAHGVPFRDVARILEIRQPLPNIVTQVLDERNNVVAGPLILPNSGNVILENFFRFRGIEYGIPGGYVREVMDSRMTFAAIKSYALFNVASVLIAIVVAWLAARRITIGAVRPLLSTTVALNALADGNFEIAPVTETDGTEVGALVAAFNRAAVTVAAALQVRDRAQLDIRRFVADAGHELRTPLTVIIGYLDALRNGLVKDGAGTERVLDTLLAESRRMRNLVNDLITLARLDRRSPSEPALVRLREILRDVVEALEGSARDRLVDAGGDAAAFVDASAVHQALRNIIDNALRYTTGVVMVEIKSGADASVVSISDEGPGMSSEEAQSVFERFYRGHRTSDIEGSGLGLAIVRQVAENAGGSVSLVSSPESGTTVKVSLPVVGGAVGA